MQLMTEGLNAKDALDFFNKEAGEEASIKEGVFHYLAKSGKITIIGLDSRGKKLYDRQSIIDAALERKREEDYKRGRVGNLLVIRDAIAYIDGKVKAELGESVEFSEYELHALVEAGEIEIKQEMIRGTLRRLYDREDLDMVIPKIIERKKLEAQVSNLMDSRQAVTWINNKLKDSGKETYDPDILLDLFYHWVGDGKINKSLTVPGKSGSFFWRYYFSEEDLSKAPCLNEAPTMPDGVKPIMVTGTKQMKLLEEQWGELITKRGAVEEELSKYAIDTKKRVKPVGFMGPTKIYPAKYIPKKRRRRGLLEEI